MEQPKSSVVSLLNEMIAKFQDVPPLSSKTTGDNKDPHALLAFVANLQINDGASFDMQLWSMIKDLLAIISLTDVPFQEESDTMIGRPTRSQLSGEEI